MASNYAATYIERLEDDTRYRLDQAAREQPELDEMSVIIACQVKIAEGRLDEARQMWLDYKKSKKAN